MPPARAAPTMNLLAAVSAAALFVLAGCVGGPETPAAVSSADASGADAVPTQDEAGNALARYAAETPIAQTVWANGTYKFQEHFFPANWVPTMLGVAPPPGMRFVDITEHVPKGVPVRVRAELDAQMSAGNVELWIQAPFEEVWSGEGDNDDPASKWNELRIIHVSDDAIQIGLFYDEPDHAAEFSYTLRVDVSYDPASLIDAVGAAISVPHANATLLVTMDAPKGSPALLVWTPEAEPVGRFDLKQGTTQVKLPDEGDYLLLLAQGSGDARLAIEGVTEAPRLRPATQEIVEFAAQGPGAEIEWTFEADRAPTQVGFFAASGTVGSDFSGSLDGPTGNLLDVSFAGGPWVRPLRGFGVGEWTQMGAPGLEKGTYNAQVSFGTSAGPDPIRYGHFVVYIAKP